jgi:hypothetical protein
LGRDFVEASADAAPKRRHGSLGGLSPMRFALGNGRFDEGGSEAPRPVRMGQHRREKPLIWLQSIDFTGER